MDDYGLGVDLFEGLHGSLDAPGKLHGEQEETALAAEVGRPHTAAAALEGVDQWLVQRRIPANETPVAAGKGAYVDFQITPTCGLASTQGIIGFLDDIVSFRWK